MSKYKLIMKTKKLFKVSIVNKIYSFIITILILSISISAYSNQGIDQLEDYSNLNTSKNISLLKAKIKTLNKKSKEIDSTVNAIQKGDMTKICNRNASKVLNNLCGKIYLSKENHKTWQEAFRFCFKLNVFHSRSWTLLSNRNINQNPDLLNLLYQYSKDDSKDQTLLQNLYKSYKTSLKYKYTGLAKFQEELNQYKFTNNIFNINSANKVRKDIKESSVLFYTIPGVNANPYLSPYYNNGKINPFYSLGFYQPGMISFESYAWARTFAFYYPQELDYYSFNKLIQSMGYPNIQFLRYIPASKNNQNIPSARIDKNLTFFKTNHINYAAWYKIKPNVINNNKIKTLCINTEFDDGFPSYSGFVRNNQFVFNDIEEWEDIVFKPFLNKPDALKTFRFFSPWFIKYDNNKEDNPYNVNNLNISKRLIFGINKYYKFAINRSGSKALCDWCGVNSLDLINKQAIIIQQDN